jgi:ADP-L-glycero-D-manno-heptose 6-epimerase
LRFAYSAFSIVIDLVESNHCCGRSSLRGKPNTAWGNSIPSDTLVGSCERQAGSMMLFKSHHPDYTDGGQMRDFVYVKDVVEVCFFLLNHRKNSGIYNLGSGEARTFLDLALNTFQALGRTADIHFKDTPEDIRDKYQYFTEADMSKLKAIGYDRPFTRLEDGIQDYVQNYLVPSRYL